MSLVKGGCKASQLAQVGTSCNTRQKQQGNNRVYFIAGLQAHSPTHALMERGDSGGGAQTTTHCCPRWASRRRWRWPRRRTQAAGRQKQRHASWSVWSAGPATGLMGAALTKLTSAPSPKCGSHSLYCHCWVWRTRKKNTRD